MVYSSVSVVFQPAAGTPNDAIPAANQHVFLDIDRGTMTEARTDSSGLLVMGPRNTPVPMDDSRDYSVAVLPSAGGVPPAITERATLRVIGGRLTVTPKIAILVTTSTGAEATNLDLVLSLGSADTPVRTSKTGWIISNNNSAGELILSSPRYLIHGQAATAPLVTVGPAAPVVRGGSAKFVLTMPSGTTRFRVLEWRYTIHHSNPDHQPRDGDIVRPETEAKSTFHQFWKVLYVRREN